MNKNIWTDVNADLPCPNCMIGFLMHSNQILSTETLQSLIDNEYHKRGLVNPDTVYLVSNHLKCNKCKDVVVMTYKLTDDVRHIDEDGSEISIIEPLSYHPAPHIIAIPTSCPKIVRELIIQSFTLFWIDLNSCGNKIRVAVEALMDDFKVIDKTNTGKTIMLHHRIEIFKKTNLKVGNYLLSIKWIGNSGSHIIGLSKEAILDAYQLLEYSLELLYNDREREMEKLSEKINKAKGHH